MPTTINLLGQKFGRLTVIDFAPSRITPKGSQIKYWKCQCDCGTIKEVCAQNLRRHAIQSCGCYSHEIKTQIHIDPTGKTFGRLTAIKEIERQGKRRYWFCQCSCGNSKIVTLRNLTSGSTRSCGCLAKETKSTHNLSKTRLYGIYGTMKQRCYNVNSQRYKNYGGRENPITICNRWMKSFENFYHDVISTIGDCPSPNHSIDRISVNGNYEIGNIKWSTAQEQANNRTSNHFIEAFGLRLTLAQWAYHQNLNAPTITKRLLRGWSVEDALTKPSRMKAKEQQIIHPDLAWKPTAP